MLRDVTIGQYLPGNSLLHRLDPRSKINGVLFFMISLFVINNMVGYWLMVISAVGMILLSRIPLKYFLKGIKPLLLIIILTVILQALMTPASGSPRRLSRMSRRNRSVWSARRLGRLPC